MCLMIVTVDENKHVLYCARAMALIVMLAIMTIVVMVIADDNRITALSSRISSDGSCLCICLMIVTVDENVLFDVDGDAGNYGY